MRFWFLAAAGVLCVLGAAPHAQRDVQSVTVTTLAGAAPLTPLVNATTLEVDSNGDFLIAGNGVIQRRASDGTLTVIAGLMSELGTLDGAGGAARINTTLGLARGADGTLYFAEPTTHVVRKMTTGGVVTTIAGVAGSSGNTDGPLGTARFNTPSGVAVDAAGIVYVADWRNSTIRRIALDGTVTTLAGSAGQEGVTDGIGSQARFTRPSDVVITPGGDLFVVDSVGHNVRRITPSGVVTFVAGHQSSGAIDGTGASAGFNSPQRIAYAGGDVFYIADFDNCAIRRMTGTGVVTTVQHHPQNLICGEQMRANDVVAVTGGGVAALLHGTVANQLGVMATGLSIFSATDARTTIYSADIQPAIFVDGFRAAARFYDMTGLAGRNGLFHVFDFATRTTVGADGSVLGRTFTINDRIRRGGVVDSSGNLFYTVDCALAGPNFQVGSVGNRFVAETCGAVDASAADARFRYPQGVAIDPDGNFIVADTGNHTIRRVTPGGVATTLAGLAGTTGSADGTGADARFHTPTGVAVSSDGVIYVADSGNHTIRAITSAGVVTTLAGSAGTTGIADGLGAAARFNTPTGVALSSGGLLYVADRRNHTIRQMSPAGLVETLAGLAGTYGSADGDAGAARFREPNGVAVDETGAIYVTDRLNFTVRVMTASGTSAPSISQQPASTAVRPNESATFTVAASGAPTPGYRWQQSADQGATWTDVTGFVTGRQTRQLTLTNIADSQHGLRIRCIVGSVAGTTTSAAATLTVYSLSTTPSSTVHFGAAKAGHSGAMTVTPPQTITVSSVSPAPPQWTATASQPWVQITNGTGTGAGSFQVGIINPDNVIGSNTLLVASVTVTAANVNLSTNFTVRLVIDQDGVSAAPIGHFDTPAQGTTGLSGAIVVSGWALDDVAIQRVEIWRDLVAGESTPPYVGPGPGNGKVFIANPDFIVGSRPDVYALYPLMPQRDRGGWGYMMLTYGLPDRGNGTYTLHAYAYDAEGQHTALGAKTIGVSNNTSVKPFGTIDSPGPGAVVSGTYTNNGWVLTPNVNGSPDCSITSVSMTIDSAPPYFPVTYNLSRPDVSAAFPGLSNTAAPGAQTTLDTTAYSNGMHTIGWVAYDSCGRGEGIGSRFITVQNSGGDAAPRPTRDLASLGMDTPESPRQVVRMDVRAHAELALPAIDGATWSGHELVGGEARRLPAGSTLDGSLGRFYWQPLQGFFGPFELRFVARIDGKAVAQVPVRVVIGPSIRGSIDTPASSSGNSVPSVLTIAGWAADLGAVEGTGIDAVHVWAYPLDGGNPIFAGHAMLGQSRPDVAAVYGSQFALSGYGLTVAHLPPGSYDIVVYPHSTVDGTFVGARVVRVHIQ